MILYTKHVRICVHIKYVIAYCILNFFAMKYGAPSATSGGIPMASDRGKPFVTHMASLWKLGHHCPVRMPVLYRIVQSRTAIRSVVSFSVGTCRHCMNGCEGSQHSQRAASIAKAFETFRG